MYRVVRSLALLSVFAGLLSVAPASTIRPLIAHSAAIFAALALVGTPPARQRVERLPHLRHRATGAYTTTF